MWLFCWCVLQVVCTAEQGQGLEILGAFVLRSSALFLDVDVRFGLSDPTGVIFFFSLKAVPCPFRRVTVRYTVKWMSVCFVRFHILL